ncbi:CpaD family pilus assembly lipoprotein [Inquilinus sp. OTU3971]|uniref:CpaD family pilus assembly lipoprotein n=1 Tax=Inquilinus sp. OTU3971 TaxID=3043855 RepID=UPI00313D2BD8
MTFPTRAHRLAVLALAGFLAACEYKIPDWPEEGYTTISPPEMHPVLFAPQASNLTPTERARLITFVRSADLSPGATMTIAAGGPQAQVRQEAVAAVLRGAGRNNLTFANDPTASDTVQVTAAGREILWPRRCLNPDGSLPEDLPLGCASDINLAQQVERRSDLFRGRAMGPAFANPSVRAAERYLQLPGTDDGGAGEGQGAGGQEGTILPSVGTTGGSGTSP